MSEKVRTGLGLVVVAVLAWLVSVPLSSDDAAPLLRMVGGLAALIAVVTGIVGLAMLAVGLLGKQDPSN